MSDDKPSVRYKVLIQRGSRYMELHPPNGEWSGRDEACKSAHLVSSTYRVERSIDGGPYELVALARAK